MSNRKSKSEKPQFDENIDVLKGLSDDTPDTINDTHQTTSTKAKHNRTPQADSNVNVYIYKLNDDTEYVFVKQGRSIISVYAFLGKCDILFPITPNEQIAGSWLSEFEKVKEVARLAGNFHPSVSGNIPFIKSLIATVSLTTPDVING